MESKKKKNNNKNIGVRTSFYGIKTIFIRIINTFYAMQKKEFKIYTHMYVYTFVLTVLPTAPVTKY